MPAPSRRKSRFSGKNRLKRVRLTCSWSASTWAKSVEDAGQSAHQLSEGEDAGALEKEVALLREEQAEAGQVDLLLVSLDLGESVRQEASRVIPGVIPYLRSAPVSTLY